MAFFKEFKEFAVKGNVVDLAVGVIIGSAFSTIVTSFVGDVITPLLGLLTGKIDFTNRFFTLSGPHLSTLAQAKAAGATTLNYGTFLNNVINFLIVAFVLFLFVRQINKLRRKNAPAPTEKCCPFCQTNIPLKATRCPHCTSELHEA